MQTLECGRSNKKWLEPKWLRRPKHTLDLSNSWLRSLDGLPNLLCHVQIIWRCWPQTGDHTCQHHLRNSYSYHACRVVASDQRPRRRYRSLSHMAPPTLPAACLIKGACFLCGSTLTFTCTSPTPVVGGNFVVDAFRIPCVISSASSFAFLLGGVNTSLCFAPILHSFLPAHIPILLHLFLHRACR